jgi:hypothetical protein
MNNPAAMARNGVIPAKAVRPDHSRGIQVDNLPDALREQLLPALETLVQQVEPEGLWLFGSWARGTASRRSDVDLLVMGLEHLGASSFPSRVFKGMRMAGRMGGDRVKVQNLQIVKVFVDQNLLVIKGSIPGPKGSFVFVEK